MKPSSKSLKLLFFLLLFFLESQLFAQLNKQYFYNQARKHIYQDEYSEAIRVLNVLIKTDSTIADAWFLRGLSKYNLNDLHGALTDFSQAINHNPVFSQAYLYRGVVYNRFARYNQALADFETAIDLRPNSADGFFSRGINHLLTQQPHKAIDDFLQVIRFQPKNIDAWINLATSRIYAGDSLTALSDYSHAIMLNPFYSESYSKRGRLYYELNNFDLALVDFNNAIRYEKESSISYFFRALTYNSLNLTDSALADLNKAIELAPENALSIYNRALIYWKKGDTKNAFYDFERVIELNPENVLVYFNRGVLYYETERFPEAVRDFTLAIDLFPDFANAYLGRSSAYARLGNYFESQKDKIYAHSIAERFGNESGQAYTDTSKKFNELIAFSSDFSTRTSIPSLDEYNSKPIDILPFIRIIGIPAEKLLTTTQQFKPIDTLNSILKDQRIALILSSGRTAINFDSIDINNDFAKAFLEGLRWSSQNKYNQAIRSYEKALNLNPDDILTQINLAAEKADMVSFIASFEKEVGTVSFEKSSRNKSNDYTSGAIQLEAFEESVAIYKWLNELLPNSSTIHYNMGNIYALSGKISAAEEEYTKAISINPNSPEAWYNRGLIKFMQNDKVNGCKDMGKAGELGVKQAYLLIHRFCRQ